MKALASTILCCFLVVSLTSQVFHGLIDGQFPIKMELSIGDTAVNGSYQYKRIGKDLRLKGKKHPILEKYSWQFKLKEYDTSNRITGIFQGESNRINPLFRENLSGRWINPKSKKELDFVVVEQHTIEMGSPFIYPEIIPLETSIPDREKTFLFLPKFHKITKKAAQKIESTLSIEKITGEPLSAIQETYEECACGYIGIDYSVNYLQDSILSMTVQSEYLGPYISLLNQYFTFNTITGETLAYTDFIPTKKISKVLKLLNQELQVRAQSIEEPSYADGHEFTKEQLNTFSLTPLGIIVYYDFGFPHALRALSPDTKFLIPWEEIQ